MGLTVSLLSILRIRNESYHSFRLLDLEAVMFW